MRPLRFLVTLLSCILAFFLLLVVGPWRGSEEAEYQEQRGSVGAYFKWTTPSSLFPPSAIISLTDDNSTFFLARPAAFGPLLPTKSLSGQLWIGSGFGDEQLGHGGYSAGAEGELGCSDVPGWSDGTYRNTARDLKSAAERLATLDVKGKRNVMADDEEDIEDSEEQPTEEDGTDDHLHQSYTGADAWKTNVDTTGKSKKPAHADIQSIQESAEIAGKIVLLSRGGCGFLEKTKWVQRRGGVALIVGDDIRGGPLVTMYARGDTSNITIPSLFTSHTTAHLLSSLIPAGGMWDELEDATRLGLALGEQARKANHGKQDSDFTAKNDGPTFTSAVRKATKTQVAKTKNIQKTTHDDSKAGAEAESKGGWFKSLFGGQSNAGSADSRRPPSSGKIGWVLQEEFEDDERPVGKRARSSTSIPTVRAPSATTKSSPTDGFRIGVQDWRDPDLVAAEKERLKVSTSSSTPTASTKKKIAKPTSSLAGGSITPGSGEYKADYNALGLFASKDRSKEKVSKHASTGDEASRGWLSRIFHAETEEEAKAEGLPHKSSAKPTTSDPEASETKLLPFHRHPMVEGMEPHDGLWVTLTPTSMSSSPFFDTLLVLVVSPLVTLTVVYALLLLRSRIRRRRWRAPKSVVERLPVRTYQTIASSAASGSTTSSAALPTATTPLLPPSSASRAINARPRPRSWSVSEAPRGSSMRSDEMASPSLEQIEEKRSAGLAEWRRRYGGKQRECVVCLEEYVDGVSRVMSLPCGHEFHAECM